MSSYAWIVLLFVGLALGAVVYAWWGSWSGDVGQWLQRERRRDR